MSEMQLVKYFDGQEIQFIEKDNELWLTAEQIGNALGYSEPRIAVSKLVERNADEFEGLTAVTKMVTPGGNQDTTIFSRDAINLICMFSKQPMAKVFRKWVLQILREIQTTGQYSIQAPPCYSTHRDHYPPVIFTNDSGVECFPPDMPPRPSGILFEGNLLPPWNTDPKAEIVFRELCGDISTRFVEIYEEEHREADKRIFARFSGKADKPAKKPEKSKKEKEREELINSLEIDIIELRAMFYNIKNSAGVERGRWISRMEECVQKLEKREEEKWEKKYQELCGKKG